MRSRQGSVLVETALVMTLLLMLLLGVFEVGRAVLGLNLLTHAVREAARLAAVDPHLVQDDPDIRAQISAWVAEGGFVVSDSAVRFTPPLQPGRLIRVSAAVDVAPLTALVFPGGAIPLQTSTVIRYER